jgi:LacI family transcriptional regulator
MFFTHFDSDKKICSFKLMNSKSIRIKDIAQLAGVSVGTVDRVLHNRGRVSEDALTKVMGVLDQIDYKPNLIARTLGANKTYRIAALMPDPKQDPYWAYSRSGLTQAEAEWMRYGVKIEPHFFDLYDTLSFKQVAESVSNSKPDGILVAPIFYHETLPFFEKFRDSGIPFVTFNTNIAEAEPLSFIGQNLYQSGRVGAELMHLATHAAGGTLVVLHINEDLDNSIHLAEKERGFREYFEGKVEDKYKIETLNITDPAHEVDENQLKSFLNNEDIKGVFVSTSKGTYLIAAFLERHDKSEIKLIGYDLLQENIKYLKKGYIDFLIHQNPRQQALMGISHLVGNLVLKRVPPAEELLPLEIISKENLESYLHSETH